MGYNVVFAPDTFKQLKKMGNVEAGRIVDYLENRISPLENPRQQGKALVGSLSGLWRYRVGDYRIICEISDGELIILVIEVAHRKDIYKAKH